MINLKIFNYARASSKAKEVYNYHKIASVLADYGYECVWLANDNHGADFLANYHDHTLRIQLKSRLSFAKKYIGKDLWIAFIDEDEVVIYNHDELLKEFPNATVFMDNNKAEAWSMAPSKKAQQTLRESEHVIYLGKIQRREPTQQN